MTPQVKWESYLQQLVDGAGGDQISVQAISNLLKIKVNILATIGTNVVVVSPTDGSCEYIVNVGLIMEKHYVGLNVCESMSNADTRDSSVTDNTSDEPNVSDDTSNEPGLGDDAIAEGDKHTHQITGMHHVNN